MKRYLPRLVWYFIKLLRITCRVVPINDQRADIRAQGKTYIYAGLHAQQIAFVMMGEPGSGAIVSRSDDGDLIADTLAKTGVVPIRGSGGATRKGGALALRAIVNHVAGGKPACIAVDGPTGPRGIVNPGVALLSKKTGAAVLPLSLVPRFRFVLKRSWDRTQVPLPFGRIDAMFADPMLAREGESVTDFADRIAAKLAELECINDPKEAAVTQVATEEPKVIGTRKAA